MSCLKPNKKLKWSLEFTGRFGDKFVYLRAWLYNSRAFYTEIWENYQTSSTSETFFHDNVRNLKQNRNWTTSLAVLYNGNINY